MAAVLAAAVYRAVPRKLSEWKLFKGNGGSQDPVDGVLAYDLNTQLFADHAGQASLSYGCLLVRR